MKKLLFFLLFLLLPVMAFGAFPTTGILDNFNRANEGPPPSASWTTVQDGFKVVSNTCRTNTGGYNWTYYNVASYGADSEIYVTLTAVPGESPERIELIVRMDTVNTNGYALRLLGSTSLDFEIFTGGVFSTLKTVAQTYVDGDSIGFSAIGTVLTAYIKHDGVWSVVSSYETSGDAIKYSAAGKIGLRSYDSRSTLILDDFGGGTHLAGPYYMDNSCTYNGTGAASSCAASDGAAGAFNSFYDFVLGEDDTLSLKKGTTIRETLTIPEAADVTVNSYGTGNAPIISGANVGFTWVAEAATGGNIYYTTDAGLTSEDQWQGVWVAGVQQAYSADKPTVSGSNLVWWDGTDKLYISPATVPDATNAEVAYRNNCIYALGLLTNLTIDGIKAEKSRGDALYIMGTESGGITITNNTINYSGFTGSTVVGSGQNGINLQGTTASSLWLTNINISGNTFTGNYNCGLEVHAAHSGSITSNSCYGNAKCVEFWEGNSGLTISKNYSSGDTSRAFWVPTLAVSGSAVSQTGLTFTYNVVITAGAGFDIYEGTDHVLLNNSVYSSYTGAATGVCFMMGWPATVSSATLKNNLCHTLADNYAVILYGTFTATIENNGWYAPNRASALRFYADGDARTFAVWQATYGYDVSGFYADPLFVSATDLRLQAGSPAINAGTDVGLTTDILGKAMRGSPDIGAYEFIPSGREPGYSGEGSDSGAHKNPYRHGIY